MPAAVLVLVLLGAMAVDRALVVMEQRKLVTVAEAAAADGVAVGVDVDHLRRVGTLRHDPGRIDRAVRAAVAAGEPEATVTWWLDGDVLHVRLRRTIDLIFAPGVVAAPDTLTVGAHASAQLLLREPRDGP